MNGLGLVSVDSLTMSGLGREADRTSSYQDMRFPALLLAIDSRTRTKRTLRTCSEHMARVVVAKVSGLRTMAARESYLLQRMPSRRAIVNRCTQS